MTGLRAPRTETVQALLAMWADTDGIRTLDQHLSLNPAEMTEEGIYYMGTEGADVYEFLMGGDDVTYEDEFEVEFDVTSFVPGRSPFEAMAAVEGFMLAMRQAVAADVGLNDAVDGLLEVVSGTVSGPEMTPLTEGWGAYGTLKFSVKMTIGEFT